MWRNILQKLSFKIQQTLSFNIQQTLSFNIQQTLSFNIQQTLSFNIQQTLSFNIQQTLSFNIQQTLSFNIQQTLSFNIQQTLSYKPRNLQFVLIIALFERPVRTSQETAASLLQRHVYVLFGAVTVVCDVHKRALKRFLPMLQQMVPTEPTVVFRGPSGSSAVIAVRRRTEICV